MKITAHPKGSPFTSRGAFDAQKPGVIPYTTSSPNAYQNGDTFKIIKDVGQPVMIYGRKQINSSDKSFWDYVGCFYPEGNIGEEYNTFFNSENIEKVLFVGFQTKIDIQMQQILNES